MDNLRFELVNILFNLAALYSQLACSSKSVPTALKTACGYFCSAAGICKHLRTTVLPDLMAQIPEDMDHWTLETLEQLMLAQAQECVWQKAIHDGLSDVSIAKISAQLSDFYGAAADTGAKSDAVPSEWIHHMRARHHHFAAAAQYRQSQDDLEKGRYGEEIARLRDCVECAAEGLRESKRVAPRVVSDLETLRDRAAQHLERALRDNDMIYLQTVPAKSELKPVARFSMASASLPPEVADPLGSLTDAGLGRPLFTKLVPYAVHLAGAIYEDRRNRMVNAQVVTPLEELTAKMRDLMNDLDLPGSIQAIEKPLGLPPSLVAQAEEVRQQDGPARLRRAIQESEQLRASDRAVFEQGAELLRAESAEDERGRRRHGTDRWTRPTSEEAAPKLYAQLKEIEGYFEHAKSSDAVILQKLADNERLILYLAGTDAELESFIPSSRKVVMSPKLERATADLRACLNDITRLEARRKRKIDAIKMKMKQDDIRRSI
jgi:programmed cell death 6-interacting protein